MSKSHYDAFISYSQSVDATLSAVLQNGLQRFAKAWYRRRASHVFRDATALVPTAPLPVAIESAIEQSKYFILLASPESAASPWVRRELEIWQRLHGVDRLLIVQTGGTLSWSEKNSDFDRDNSSALPQQLFGVFKAEPLFIDLSRVSGPISALRDDLQVQDAIATLASAIQQRPKDDLVGEDLVQHRRTLRLAWGAAGLLLVLAIFALLATFWAVQQRDIAEARELQARAGQLAADSSRLLNEQPEQLELAALLAIESINRDAAGNGQRALAAATRLLPSRVAESYAGYVHKLAFSPDTRWLARGDTQMGVMLWDLDSGEIGQLSTAAEIYEQLQVRALQFSPDGKRLAIASGGSTARVYDLPNADNERVFNHDDRVVTVAFDPDGKRLATGARDGRLRVWDVASQALLFDEYMTSEEVRVVRFNHDGSLLGAVATNGPFRLFTTDDWRLVELERVTPGEGLALDFSPDGTLLAISRANRAVIWSLQDGRVIASVEHSDFTGDAKMDFDTHLWELEFSPDSTLLVSSGRDGTVRFWRPQTGEEVLRLTHNTSVENVAFSTDGQRIATASYGLVQLWSLPDGNEILRVAPTDGGNAMALSDDGTLIATGGPQWSVRVMRTESPTATKQLKHVDDVVAVACHPTKPLIATADDRHNVQVWDTTTESSLGSTNLFGSRRLRFSTEDEVFIAAQSVLARMDASGSVQKLVPRYADDLVLHRDYVAARISGGSILIWPTLGDAEPVQIDADAHGDIRFSENGRILLSKRFADSKGTAHLWDVRNGNELWQVDLEYGFGNTLAADAAGDTLAVAYEKKLTLFERKDNSVRTLEFEDQIRAMVFLEDGSRLAVLLDQDLAVFDAGDLEASPVTFNHNSDIQFISFNDNRRYVASTTGRNVSVWDLMTGARLADWPTSARVSRMCFLAGDESLVIGDDDDQATIRPWRTTDLVSAACERLTRNLTEQEWDAYLPGVPYQTTCPALQPLSRDRLLEAMNPRSPFDPPE